MAATDARVHFGAVLRSLRRTDIVVERGGVPIAAIIDFDTYSQVRDERRRRARLDEVIAHRPSAADVAAGVRAWSSPGTLADEEVTRMLDRLYEARRAGSRKQRRGRLSP